MRQARNREKGHTPKTEPMCYKPFNQFSLKNKFLLAHECLCCMLELPAHWTVRTPYDLNYGLELVLKIRRGH